MAPTPITTTAHWIVLLFLGTLVDMAGTIRLCGICQNIDFNPCAYRVVSEPTFHHPSEDIQLGTVKSISQRAVECTFCTFIIQHCKESITRPGYWRELTVKLHYNTLGWILNNAGDDPRQLIKSSVALHPSKYCGPTVDLVPILVPVPSVREYLGAPSLHLAYGGSSFSGRLIEDVADIGLPKKWLALCQKSHGTLCEAPSWLSPHEYPVKLRLLDVHKMCVVEAQEQCDYICLSYVWGPAQLQEKIYATLERMTTYLVPGSIRGSSLPRTLADAVSFVRDMGQRYLWVDALCILQDDPVDRQVQIQQMDLIYARALLTIAVVNGQDCESGISHLYRKMRNVSQPYVQLSSDMGLMLSRQEGYYQNEEKWATRGWTYQELQLSRRILMVCKNMLHWRCECDYWNEAFCLEPSEAPTKTCKTFLSVSLNISLPGKKFDHRNLGNHIYFYNSGRDFSNDGDAFDAFYGILKRVQMVSGIRYHWGLARTEFHTSLLWTDETTHGWRKNKRRLSRRNILSRSGDAYSVQLPSWSWLGWCTRTKVVSYAEDELQVKIPQVIEWASVWFALNMDGNLSRLDTQRPPIIDVCSTHTDKNHPKWAGGDLSQYRTISENIYSDTGCIVSNTSYARCRVRAQLFDHFTRREGREPRDGFKFDVLDEKCRVVGQMRALDLVNPVEEWTEEKLAEEETKGRVRDFVAISCQRGDPEWSEIPSIHDKDGDKMLVNLMLVVRIASGERFSRLGIFQVEEVVWSRCSPTWDCITLG